MDTFKESTEKIDDLQLKMHEMTDPLIKLAEDAKVCYEATDNEYFKDLFKILNRACGEASAKLIEAGINISSKQIIFWNDYLKEIEEPD